MKRKSLWAVLTAALLTVTGCFPADTAPPAPETAPHGIGSTTLMVYMIGADTEAASGTASAALEDLAQAGVDLAVADVVVYAGGTKNWQNETVKNRANTTLRLTADGFEAVNTTDAVSMGKAETLTAFLNDTVTACPADNYALVIWAQGHGAATGLGEDRLFDDMLTLTELDAALHDSPFGNGERLTFLGLDMNFAASLEIACAVDSYADYLLASQDVVSAAGWDYTFLSALGKTETPALLRDAVTRYEASCQAYAQAHGFADSEHTLSCLDLAFADAAVAATESLFSAAASLPDAYPTLAAARIRTREFGRTYTDAVWDLTDLADTAQQLLDVYPTEAQTLQDTVGSLVLHRTDATDACGVSLYYPFFGADNTIGVHPQGLSGFDAYVKALLRIRNEGANDTFLTLPAPMQTADGTFVLTLDDALAARYVTASYTVCAVDDQGLYTPLYTSAQVCKEGNTFTAVFDGSVIYARTGFGAHTVPAYTLAQTVGDTTVYRLYATVSNDPVVWSDLPLGTDQVRERTVFVLQSDGDALSVAAQMPYSEAVSTRPTTVDLAARTQYLIPTPSKLSPRREFTGVLGAVSSWRTEQFATAKSVAVGDGLSFTYAPLAAGTYTLLIELTDIYGHTVCARPTTFETDGVAPPSPAPLAVTLGGGTTTLLDSHDVTVSLSAAADGSLTLSVENRRDHAVALTARMDGGEDRKASLLLSVPSGETALSDHDLVPFSVNDTGVVELVLTVQHAMDCTTLVYEQQILLTL